MWKRIVRDLGWRIGWVLIAGLWVCGLAEPRPALAGHFQSIDQPGIFEEFVKMDGTPLTVAEAVLMLGGVRSVTTGDYDGDGDEDVLVARFAKESEGVHQFVMYWNQAVELGGTLRFKLQPNALPLPLSSAKAQGTWDNWDGTEFAGLATADFNQDGWPDIFAGGSYVESATETILDRSALFMNQRDGTFVEVGLEAGLTDTSWFCVGASVGDFNRDGLLDIFLANHDATGVEIVGSQGGVCQLFLATDLSGMTAEGISFPHFVDASVAWGVPQDRVPQFDPTAADFDGDGDLDIFVGRRAVEWDHEHCSLDQPVPDIFLVNQHANGTSGFVESAVAYGVADPGDAYGAAWGDVDNDGDLDLLLANNRHPVEPPCVGKPDNMMKLFRNNVPGPFNTFAVPDFADTFALQINNGAVFFDYDLDGLQDFFIAVEADDEDWGDLLFHQESPGVFEERSQVEGVVQPYPTGVSCNPLHRIPEGTNGTYADFDGDGDLDLFVPRGDRPGVGAPCGRGGEGTLVFRNLTRDIGGGNYLVIRLQGRDGGGFAALRDAIGSKVHVYVGSTMYTQQVCAGGQDGST